MSANGISGDTPAASYERLFDVSHDLLCVAGTDGYFQRVNPSFERVLGHPSAEFLAQPIASFVHPSDRAASESALARLGAGETAIEFHDRFRCADGTHRWLHWRASYVTADRLIYAVARDVTRARRETMLLEQTQRAARVGGWELDFESGELYWTAETYRLHEVSPETFTPDVERAIAFYTPESRPLITEAIERARRDGTPYDLELEVITAKGNRMWVRATGDVLREGGRLVGAYGAFQDVSAQRRSREQASRFQSLVQTTPNFVGFAATDERVLYVNRAGLRLVGIEDPDGWRGLTVGDFHPPAATRALRETAIPTAVRDGIWTGESVLVARDGTEIPVAQVIVAHRGSDGEVEFLSTVMRDLREQRALEEQLLQSQRLEAIGRLAGGVAHDFNNLLTAILGNAQIATRMLPDTSPCKHRIQAITDAGQRAASLTGQLLAFAQRQIIEPRVVRPAGLVSGMADLLRRLIGENVELRTRLAEDTWPIRVDPGQFEQVLLNLAVNARDAMPDGGQLVIETRNTEHGQPGCHAHGDLPRGEYVDILVSDTGEGVPENARAHLFEPFFTTKPAGEGTGLGLATCLGIAEQNGGRIWLEESRAPRGTTFRVCFPRATDEPEDGPDAPPVTGSAGTERILLVEDDAAVRELAASGLRSYGFTVLEAASGEDAVELAAEAGRIDLLLTDVVLPGMNGREVADALSARQPGIKVLFASGYAERSIVEKGVLVEGLHFIPKPYTPETLSSAVRAVLDA